MTDNDLATGYQQRWALGADYRIKDGKLQVWMGTPTSEVWGDGRDPDGIDKALADAPVTFTGSGIVQHEWTVYRFDMGEVRLNDDTLKAVFRCDSGGTFNYTGGLLHTFTP